MRTAIVIEDEPTLCEVITEALESAGVTVRCSTTGALGIMMLQRDHFDLALIDVGLPDASGIAIAEIATSENIPVLFMSGDLSITDGLTDWGMPCLEKPFRLAALHAEVVRVMDDSQSQIQLVRDTLTKMRAIIDQPQDILADSKRLIDISCSLVDRVASSSPMIDR